MSLARYVVKELKNGKTEPETDAANKYRYWKPYTSNIAQRPAETVENARKVKRRRIE